MYKLYTKLKEDQEWIAVLDVKLSRVNKVDRIFMNREEAEAFVKQQNIPDNMYKIEEQE